MRRSSNATCNIIDLYNDSVTDATMIACNGLWSGYSMILSLPHVICFCLRIEVSNTYGVVCCCFSSCVPCVVIFADCVLLLAPSVFSDVYL